MKTKSGLSGGFRRLIAVSGLVIGAAALSGCETLAVTALGLGASAGMTHKSDSVTYRTFTAPTAKVLAASLRALRRMGIALQATDPTDNGRVIKASTPEYEIEVEIEAISPSATRVRAVAKRSMFSYDGATAREIIEQTERALGQA